MAEAIVNDQKRVLPCTVYLDGEYGISDVCVGVPIKLGKNGIEEIIELKLNNEEKALFDDSANHVKKTIQQAMELIKEK